MPASLTFQKQAQLTGHEASIFALSPYLSGDSFLSGAGDGWIVEWSLEKPDLGRLIAKVEAQIFSLCYLPQVHAIVAGDMNGGVHWIYPDDNGRTIDIAHHQKGVFGILAKEENLITIGGLGVATLWDTAKARTLESIQLSSQSLRSLDYSPQRREIAIGASDNNIYLLDADNFALRQKIASAHDNSVFSVKYTPDGSTLLSGGRDAMLKAWSLEAATPNCTNSLPAHWFTINSIVFHPEGRLFATASRDKTIKIWDSQGLKLLKVLEMQRDGGHLNSVNRLLWLSHQNTLISASDDRSMILWKTEMA
jgi:WD40 repeat protein